MAGVSPLNISGLIVCWFPAYRLECHVYPPLIRPAGMTAMPNCDALEVHSAFLEVRLELLHDR